MLSLVVVLMCALSPVSVPHMAQGQFSMGGVGTFPAWNVSQGAAHWVQFDATCKTLTCRVATHSNDEGDVSRASPWAFPDLLELFPNVFHAGGFRGLLH